MKHQRTVEKEEKLLGELWRVAPIGDARAWFLFGAAWALLWVRGWNKRPSRFAEKPWECDRRKR